MADNSLFARIRNAWNAFSNRDPTHREWESGYTYSENPDRPILMGGNEKSMTNSIINRFALDVAALTFHHVQLDENGRYLNNIDDELDQILNLSANVDETGRAFIQKAIITMLDQGTVALVPVYADKNPNFNDDFKVEECRVGRVLEWKPTTVRLEVYNSETGKHDQVTFKKSAVCLMQNPFYTVMNETNSTFKRLVRKMNLLDLVDEQACSGKLDMIIQLPYAVKSDMAKQRAEDRRKAIEDQMTNSKYGIAYIDSTEHITQLNRAVENNMLKAVEYYQNLAFSELGITIAILNGTAKADEKLAYRNNITQALADTFVNELRRKFLSADQRANRESVSYFVDPWKLVPIEQVAELTDKLIRNEVSTANEVRQGIGMIPSKDPKADQLRNPNISESDEQMANSVDSKTGQKINNGVKAKPDATVSEV